MKKTPLTQIEKDYIKLYLSDLQRTTGKITPPDMEALAKKLNRELETITRFAAQQPELIHSEPEKTASSAVLTHIQKTIRNTILNETATGKGSKVAVMSEGASTLIAEQQKIDTRNIKSKYDRNIYRGNK